MFINIYKFSLRVPNNPSRMSTLQVRASFMERSFYNRAACLCLFFVRLDMLIFIDIYVRDKLRRPNIRTMCKKIRCLCSNDTVRGNTIRAFFGVFVSASLFFRPIFHFDTFISSRFCLPMSFRFLKQLFSH